MKRKVWIWLLMGLCMLVMPATAQDWRENMKNIIYSPRYFGANAFPVPDLTGGKLSDRWEVELRGEYHTMPGDQTKDLFLRLYAPIAGGKAGVTVCGVLREWYETSEAVRDERHAAETRSPIPCFGDIIVNSYYQVLRSERFADLVVTANLKTASGGRLADARFTDAASYWFTFEAGRDLWADTTRRAYVRVEGLAGFYCWMTNDMVHRQNDAFCYGLGLRGRLQNFSAHCDYSGIRGYESNGDRLMILRLSLSYEIKKNVVTFGYKHGVQDYLYDSFSLGYTRCF